MRRPGKAVLFSVLLVWSLLVSQCALCPQMQASQPSPHDCCKPAKPDHCSRPDPQKQCPGHDSAFESYAKVEVATPSGVVHVAAEATTAATAELILVPAFTPYAPGAQHPPPERFLLTTVLLI
jgi:hypothetical protein